MNGCLPNSKKENLSRFPYLLVYLITTMVALTLPSHKELRFMSVIYQFFAITAGAGFVHVSK